MGPKLSTLKDVRNSEELKTFLGENAMEDDAVRNLLQFQIKPPKTIEDCKFLVKICRDLKNETPKESSKNLPSLVEMTAIPDISETSDEESLKTVFNGLFFIKWFCLAYSDDTEKLLDVKQDIEALMVPFLIRVITSLEIVDKTYHIILEACDILAILLDISPKMDLFDNEKSLIGALLKNFISQTPAPVFPFQQPSGLGHALASGMWAVMTVGMGSMNETVDPDYKPLSHSCIALLLKLVDSNTLCNSALCNLTDNKDTNFSDLHYLLLANNEFLPFLKKMLRSNMAYRKFVIMATDMSLLLGPVLKDLYSFGDQDSDELSEKFELLQIMCKDDLFNQAIHSCSKSGSFAWYKEKALKNTKLGGMLILILLRSILQNKNDTIFQKTCMNILVEMSVQISLLDLYPSERLVACLEILLKKHSRLVMSSETLDANNTEDLVKNLMVIINNALINQNNPNLVYSLLYKREILKSYTKENEEFLEHFQNVNNLLDHVSQKIDELNDDSNSIIDTSYLLSIIQAAILEYPKKQLPLPETNKETCEPTVELAVEEIGSVAAVSQSEESESESNTISVETKDSEIDEKDLEEEVTKNKDEIPETVSVDDTLKENELPSEDSGVKEETLNEEIEESVVLEPTVELAVEKIETEAITEQSKKLADDEVEVADKSNTIVIDTIKSEIEEKDTKEEDTETEDEIKTIGSTDDTLKGTELASEGNDEKEEIEEIAVEKVSGEVSTNSLDAVIVSNESTTNIVEAVEEIIPEQDIHNDGSEATLVQNEENTTTEDCSKNSEVLNEKVEMEAVGDVAAEEIKSELCSDSHIETAPNEIDQEVKENVVEQLPVESVGATDPCDEASKLAEVDNNEEKLSILEQDAETKEDIAANIDDADSIEVANDTNETISVEVDNAGASEEETQETSQIITEVEETISKETISQEKDSLLEEKVESIDIVDSTSDDQSKDIVPEDDNEIVKEEDTENNYRKEQLEAPLKEESCEATKEDISQIHTDQNNSPQSTEDTYNENKTEKMVGKESTTDSLHNDEIIDTVDEKEVKEEVDECSEETIPDEIPKENITKPVEKAENLDEQTEKNVNYGEYNEVPDKTVNNSTDDHVIEETTATPAVVLHIETVASEDTEATESKIINEETVAELTIQKETVQTELELKENVEEVSCNEEVPLDNEVISDGSANLEDEPQKQEEKIPNDEDTTDNESQESESSTLVEFEAFNKEDKSPVTFLIDSKMLDKLLIGSKSKIVITDFEILSSAPVRNRSGDSGVISQDEEAEEKQNAAEAAIYKEFADQQRRINFAQIHNEKEKPAPKSASSGEAMSTNLFLAGSNIKFDLDEKLKIIGTSVSPSANVIWKRAGTV